jgi:L-ascorbate metabolism protein UlaG (beta-lactamase superfamily)
LTRASARRYLAAVVQRVGFGLVFLVGCGTGAPAVDEPDAAAPGSPDAEVAPQPRELAVQFLGVQGFVLARGDDIVLTAPMFTRGSLIDVSLGNPVPADTAAIDAGLAGIDLASTDAIVTGHGHYDHLIDVPHIMTNQAPAATLFANASAKHVFAAVAPDRAPHCTGPAPAATIARDRVVAFDDSLASAIDYRNCPDLRPAGAPLEGSWVDVPGARVRIYPICSVHPDQFLFIHFGPGAVTTDQCELPAEAGDWLEGTTMAFLIDFLDDDGATAFRVYYQDAPSDTPIAHPPADILADHPVDLALLCVGNAEQVMNHPTEIVTALAPRFALSGHWEDFFQPLSHQPQPIPFLDLDAYRTRADAALPGPAQPPLVVDGEPSADRHVIPLPGMRFVVPGA